MVKSFVGQKLLRNSFIGYAVYMQCSHKQISEYVHSEKEYLIRQEEICESLNTAKHV